MKILDKNKIVPYLKEQFGKFLSTVKNSKGKPVNEIAKSILGTFFGRAICIVCGVLVVGTIGLSTGIGKSNKASDFVLIPAGTFQMGSNQGGRLDKPVHTVTLTKSFYMCDHEVTQKEYEDVMGINPSRFVGEEAEIKVAEGEVQKNRPVEMVSWNEAIVYCNKRSIKEDLTPCYTLNGKTDPAEWGKIPFSGDAAWNKVECNWTANGYRLPTEAEWEYAARAGDATVDSLTWSGTNVESSLGDYAWYSSNADEKTHEVKKKKPNAWGLYDMTGNVCEWCWDWWSGSNSYSADAVTDPRGASKGLPRIFRDGGIYDGADDCAVSNRSCEDPGDHSRYHGFRVCRSSVSNSSSVETTADKKDSSAEVKTEKSTDKKEAKTVKNKSNGKKNHVDLDMVKIPGANFEMLRTQVTQKLYVSVMGENPSFYSKDNPKIKIKEGLDTENFPVDNISWYDAIYFCNKLSMLKGKEPVYTVDGESDVTKWNYVPYKSGEDIEGKVRQNRDKNGYRLPTVEEWRYAERGDEKYCYSGSNDREDVCEPRGGEVAKFMPNGYGLYGMTSDYDVWCWDMSFKDPSIRNMASLYKYGSKEDDFLGIIKFLADYRESWFTFRIVCTAK